MARVDLTRILRTFYSTGLRYLPVVDDENADADSVIGFIPRVRLDREMADLSRAGRELDELPPELILNSVLPGDLIPSLSGADSVPVLDGAGNQVGSWNSADTLRALAIYRESVGAPEPSSDDGASDARENGGSPGAATSSLSSPAHGESPARDGADWLARLILSEISFPLFVSDLDGRTLFYNQSFEATILNHAVLKKSIRLAEEYLLEVQRTLLAKSVQEGAAEGRVLRTRIAELEMSVDIISLSSESKLVGYLYIFRAPAETALYEEIARMLEGKLSYDEIVDDVESHIILAMLERYEQNVSHTAGALKLRRTTLQNKIKRLKLDTRRPVRGPIPRHRRTKDELEAERIRNLLAEADRTSAAGNSPVQRPPARGGHMSDLIGEIARDVAAKRGVEPPASAGTPTAEKRTPAKKAPAAHKKDAARKKDAADKKPAAKKPVAKKMATKKTTKSAKKVVKKIRGKTAAPKKAPAAKKKTALKKKAGAGKKPGAKRAVKKKKSR